MTAPEEEKSVEIKPQNPKPVYQALARHQVTDEAWELRELLAWLQTWAHRFIEEFGLDVAEVALCVDWLHRHRLGHFRRGRNGFGLAGEVALNRRYLNGRQPWELLGTLLHELFHAWQEVHGSPGKNNYHNRQFREKARAYGLVIDPRGCTQYEPGSAFFRLLEKYEVEIPDIPPVTHIAWGASKLKKWSCRCQPPVNVRVAVAHFYARCLWCGELFQRSD